MSLHKTTLPLDLSKVIAVLPPRSDVEKIEIVFGDKLAGRVKVPVAIELVWSNDGIKTPYTVPVEYPLEKLLPPVDKPAEAVKKKSRP